MKILFFVSAYYPHPTGNGSSVLMHGFITCLQQLGYEIIVVPVSLRYTDKNQKNHHKNSLEKEGIEILFFGLEKIKKTKSFFAKARALFWPIQSDSFYSNLSEKKDLVKYIKDNNINHVLSYDWESLAVIYNLENVKKIASLVDLIDEVHDLRWKGLGQFSIFQLPIKLYSILKSRKKSHFAYEHLKSVDLIVEHAYQHAEKLIHKGFKNVHYIPHPLPQRNEFVKKDNNQDQVQILIMGSLKGIASRLGFEFFLNEVLPRLKQKKEKLTNEITFRIVGHGEMIPSLKQKLVEEPWVKFVGFVENIEEEYQNCDLTLVNIPVAHGFRTRIAECFSYGLCVVAHAANAEGMPEIKDEINAMISSDPELFVDKLIRVINDKSLRETLGNNARQTFNTSISIDSAVQKLEKILP
jgi:glycosyltransferase involved in cell wall biosynthesis